MKLDKRVKITQEEIGDFCKRNHIRRLAFFGSVLRDDFTPDSDVDILVELDHTYPTGFLKMAQMEIELSEMIGRKLDLRTPKELSRYFRDEVLAEAEVHYEEGCGTI
ncbi:nucleotidyltransferase family protein [Candidatus Poribacteria bacterium]